MILTASKLLAGIISFFFLVNKKRVLEVQPYLNVSVLLKIYNRSNIFFNTTTVMYPDIEH